MAAQPHDQTEPAKAGAASSITQSRVLENGPDKGLKQSETSKMPPGYVARVQKSWRASSVILSTLLAGLGCALAHHFTNSYLSGRVVADTSIPQAWVLRLQTIFAFLVKMFLTVSVGAAFVQRQWWNFHRQPFSVREIDAVTTALGDVFGLLTLSAWRKAPLLAVAALISWIVPFAAVISPGSLSIALNETQSIVPDQVPQPFFNNSAAFTEFSSFGSAVGITSIGDYLATTELWQVALSVGVSGQLASFSMPYRNMTYRYQFNGPAIKCETVQNVTEFTNTLTATFQGNLTSQNYTSWVPGAVIGSDSSQSSPLTLDSSSNDSVGAGIYIALGNGPGYDGRPAIDSNTNVTGCRLHNGFYDVLYQFRYPEQNLTLLNLTYGLPISGAFGNVDTITDWSPVAYAGVMETLGRLLVGSISEPAPTGMSIGTQQVSFTSATILHVNWCEAEATRTGLERLFQNITLSILSRGSFIKNSTQADSIPVTVFNFVNVYHYDKTDLFLAYGLALLGTLLCAVVGLHATWANRGSYRNTFSTFMRSTDDAELRSLIDSDDCGRDPLPKKLAYLKVTMHGHRI